MNERSPHCIPLLPASENPNRNRNRVSVGASAPRKCGSLVAPPIGRSQRRAIPVPGCVRPPLRARSPSAPHSGSGAKVGRTLRAHRIRGARRAPASHCNLEVVFQITIPQWREGHFSPWHMLRRRVCLSSRESPRSGVNVSGLRPSLITKHSLRGSSCALFTSARREGCFSAISDGRRPGKTPSLGGDSRGMKSIATKNTKRDFAGAFGFVNFRAFLWQFLVARHRWRV